MIGIHIDAITKHKVLNQLNDDQQVAAGQAEESRNKLLE